jgi:hypothetical protein
MGTMEHDTGNKAVPQFVVMELLTKNFVYDEFTVKICSILTTELYSCPIKTAVLTVHRQTKQCINLKLNVGTATKFVRREVCTYDL